MDELAQTIENAAANVNGGEIMAEKQAADEVPVKEINGQIEGHPEMPQKVVEAVVPAAPVEEVEASKTSAEATTAVAAEAEQILNTDNGMPEKEKDATNVETTAAEPAAPSVKEASSANQETKGKEEEEKSQPSSAAAKVEPEVAPATTTTNVDEEPHSTTEVSSTGDAPPAPVESVPELTPETVDDASPVIADQVDEKIEEAEKKTEEEPEKSSPPSKEDSVIDLDTTLDTSSDFAQGTEDTVAGGEDNQTKDQAVVLLDDDDSSKDPAVVLPVVDAPSAMEVTIDVDTDVDRTLETPNVSVCPLDKPQLLAHNRISELVLSNGSSTPNTSNPTSVEFQATPIKRSSIEEKLEMMEAETTTTTTDASLSCQEISSKSSCDGDIKRLQDNLKEINGTTTTEISSSGEGCVSQVDNKHPFIDLATEDHQFDAVLNMQNGLLQCLYVERLVRPIAPVPAHTESSDAASEKSASNGSATSLGPFALPGALTHTASGLSVSSTSSVVHTGERSRLQGVTGLRNFLQELLKKLPAEASTAAEEKKKPVGRGAKGRSSTAAPVAATAAASPAPSKAATNTSTKTAATVPATVPKSAESAAKKQVAFAAGTESLIGNFVMARWSDKKYYAGRVSAEKPGNKYMVRFEDGAQRTLGRDQLVFGDKSVAASLMNHECNVLVEPNIYETGLVVAIDADACTYSVLTDSGTVTVPASDLYLDDDQAKAVQLADGGVAAAEEAAAAAATTTTSGRRKRNSDLIKSSPEAGPSGVAEPAAKKSRKRQQPPPPQFQSCDSQLSDISDTFDCEPKVPEISYVEAVDGVQPELSSCPAQAKIKETCGYRDAEDQLGGLPLNRTLFRNKHFIVTAPEVTRHSATSNDCFSDLPFDLDHLLLQLRYGGATIYEHFEEVPKGKYKSCVVITREPCLTARYIQCLAVNMVAVSHGWVIECCRQNQLVDLKAFALPAGWSMVEGKYVRYVTGRNEKRANAHPFMGLSVLISSENDDFIKFWTRVCKFGDAKVKAITSVLDITAGKKTYLLTDSELEVANVEKAKAVGMPIVSTAWVSECLIQGRPVQPEEHPNFTKANWDLS